MDEFIHLTGLAIIVSEIASLMVWQMLRPRIQPDTWLSFFTTAGVGVLICLAGGAILSLILPPLENPSQLPAIAAGAAIGVAVVLQRAAYAPKP